MPVSAWCYIPTSLPPNFRQYFTILSWIEALDTKRPVERGFVTTFYTANVVLFQAFPASWGIISHMLVLATPSLTVHNTKYLDPYHQSHISFSCLFLLLMWIQVLDTKRPVERGFVTHFLYSNCSAFPGFSSFMGDNQSYVSIRIVGSWSSSLVSVLFRETFSHPYISFFHLLVNSFPLLVCFHFYLNIGTVASIITWNCHNVCTVQDKYTKLTSVFLKISPNSSSNSQGSLYRRSNLGLTTIL